MDDNLEPHSEQPGQPDNKYPIQIHYQTLDEILDELCTAARKICFLIQRHQPEIVISLMHSGFLPAAAAQMVWEKTLPGKFPPLVRLNVGQEKVDQYYAARQPNVRGSHVIYEGWMVADLLMWLKSRQDWLGYLRQQVAQALGQVEPPQHILIVDEFVAVGSTRLFILSLIEAAYPGCEVWFFNAFVEWGQVFEDSWLRQYPPATARELKEGMKRSLAEFTAQQKPNFTVRMFSGTMDTDPERLDWQEITADSPFFRGEQGAFLAAHWLKLPEFVLSTLQDAISKCAAFPFAPVKKFRGHFKLSGGLPLEYLVQRDMLAGLTVTRHSVMERYHINSYRAGKVLNELLIWNDIQAIGKGKSVRYEPSPEIYTGVFGITDRPYDWYAILPGQLWTGKNPASGFSPRFDHRTRRELLNLLASGIDTLIEVDTDNEKTQEGYEAFLSQLATDAHTTLAYQYISLYSSKESKQARPILIERLHYAIDVLTEALGSGKKIYLTGSYGYEIVLGCFLAERQGDGKKAIQALEACRAESAYPWRSVLRQPKDRRLVLRWLSTRSSPLPPPAPR